jgi:hypothetical protein
LLGTNKKEVILMAKPCKVGAVLSALIVILAFLEGALIRIAIVLSALVIFMMSVKGVCPDIFMKGKAINNKTNKVKNK